MLCSVTSARSTSTPHPSTGEIADARGQVAAPEIRLPAPAATGLDHPVDEDVRADDRHAAVPGAEIGEVGVIADDQGGVAREGEIHDQVVLVVFDVEALPRGIDGCAARGLHELEHGLEVSLDQLLAELELAEDAGQVADDVRRDEQPEIVTVEGEREAVGRGVPRARWHLDDLWELGAWTNERIDVDVDVENDRWAGVRLRHWSAESSSRGR